MNFALACSQYYEFISIMLIFVLMLINLSYLGNKL